MSDDAPKKRAWFQIHLSTAVVLIVVAGVLVWINVSPRIVPPDPMPKEVLALGISFTPQSKFSEYGWPFTSYCLHEFADGTDFGEWGLGKLILNCLNSLTILTAVAVGCEGWVRRRGSISRATTEFFNKLPFQRFKITI